MEVAWRQRRVCSTFPAYPFPKARGTQALSFGLPPHGPHTVWPHAAAAKVKPPTGPWCTVPTLRCPSDIVESTLQNVTVWDCLDVNPVSAGRGVDARGAECFNGEQQEGNASSRPTQPCLRRCEVKVTNEKWQSRKQRLLLL